MTKFVTVSRFLLIIPYFVHVQFIMGVLLQCDLAYYSSFLCIIFVVLAIILTTPNILVNTYSYDKIIL